MNNDFLKKETLKLCELCDEAINNGFSVVITGHDMPDCDSVISAVMLRKLLSRLGTDAAVKFGTHPDGITFREMKAIGILDNVTFEGFEASDKLVLVDHHQCFYKNEVIACVDHHLTPPEPNFRLNLMQRASACARTVYDMSVSCNVADEWMERMAVLAVYYDTQSCRSLKFLQSDLPWLNDALPRLGLDENALTKMGFCLNSPDESIEQLADYGYKKYAYGENFGASTYIQIEPEENGWSERIGGVVERLKQRRAADGAMVWAFLVNMPGVSRTDIYFIREEGVELVKLDRLASRSRDVIPVVMKNLGYKG